VIQKLKTDEAYWYINTVPERQKQKEAKLNEEKPWYDQDWVSKLIWFLVIAGFVAILIWFLASSNIKLFRKKPVFIVDEAQEITEENIFSLNYEREIRKAMDQQNYRLGIRLWYLFVLTELAQRNIIEFKHERTNSEYIHQLYGTTYYKDFFRLTRSFEYIWYGRFELTPDIYARLQNDFLNFKQQLS
jgi:hypothetical protein